MFLQFFNTCYIPALYKEHIHSYKDFLTPPWKWAYVNEWRGRRGQVLHGGCGHTKVAYSDRTHCFVNARWGWPHMLLAFFGCCCTQTQWLYKTVSDDTRIFFFHMLQPSVPKWPLLNHLWIYYLSTAMEKEATAYVTLTNHSSQIRIMPMDSEVLFSLPWLSRQLYVWLSLQACYDLKGASLSTKISSYH